MIINTTPFGFPVRVILRTRLTQGRLTWPWNPWLFGVGVLRPHYRYLCLHLRFPTLQHASRHTFTAAGMLPYHNNIIRGFGDMLDTRALSMQGRSTSELLRTL